MKSRFDKGRDTILSAIAQETGMATIEVFEVYARLNEADLIDRKAAQRLFEEVASEDSWPEYESVIEMEKYQ